jgi:hypothetical protein
MGRIAGFDACVGRETGYIDPRVAFAMQAAIPLPAVQIN